MEENQKSSEYKVQTSSVTASKQSASSKAVHSWRLLLGCAFLATLLGLVLTPWSYGARHSLSNAYVLCSPSKNIWTVDPARERVECLGVQTGRIFSTGSRDEVQAAWATLSSPDGAGSEKVLEELQVRASDVVVPGLTDAHAHVLQYGHSVQLSLEGSSSIAEIVHRIKAYINSHPDVLNDSTRWIEGMGWDQTKWEIQDFPTAADISSDPLLKDRPIVLYRIDVHAAWLSERALELTRVAQGGTLPSKVDGGDIIRDSKGTETGVLIDNAMSLVPVPAWTEAQTEEYYQRAMHDALAVGLTSIHDADTEPQFIKFFKRKAEEGTLPLRLYLMGNVPSEDYWGSKIPRMENYGVHRRLSVKSVKLFTDGALGSWGAALLEPYSDRTDYSGLLRISPEKLENLVDQFWKDGFQTNIHCIGDRANHVVLNIFERMFKKYPNLDGRPRIEHAQIMTQDDLKRTGELGVIASVQPTHATSDMWYAETRLGAERIKGAYAYSTLLNVSSKSVLPLGSDFPVEGINPLLGFYAAVSRLSVKGDSPHGSGGWRPEQRLTRLEALKGMTLDAAYASFAEKDIGSIEPSKKADFVILDKNIMRVPFHEILEAKVKATVIDGQIAYGEI